MIQELEILAPEFASFASHTQCFLHIVNLVVKSLLHQFDAKKMTIKRDIELATLADKLSEEGAMMDEIEDNNNSEDVQAKTCWKRTKCC